MIMDNNTNGYHISFFKPTTPQAKSNRNMVIWLVLIWFIAIFGFQVLLKLLEKPTPENAYLDFQKVWGNVENGTANYEELMMLGQSTLSVLSKVMINTEERTVLNNALSNSIYQLTADSLKEDLLLRIHHFENVKTSIEDISDTSYITAKMKLSSEISSRLNISPLDVRSKILPLELSSANIETITDDTKANLPSIMKKYLVHNQSVLTDAKFLGFPFHYFYTAIFLLIMFVVLCLLYCIFTDKLNAKLNIAD